MLSYDRAFLIKRLLLRKKCDVRKKVAKKEKIENNENKKFDERHFDNLSKNDIKVVCEICFVF